MPYMIRNRWLLILNKMGKSRKKMALISQRRPTFVDPPTKRMQWRDWKEKFGKKRPAYIIIKNNLNKNLKTFLENNHIKSYNWKFFIENKLNPLIYALPKFWSRFSFSDTKIAKKVRSTVVAVRVVCVKFVQW